jgi:hypothetical protein
LHPLRLANLLPQQLRAGIRQRAGQGLEDGRLVGPKELAPAPAAQTVDDGHGA